MKKVLLLLLLLVLLLAGGVYIYLLSTRPEYDGTLTLSGLQKPVTVKYDEYGIPHIYAENETDAYFALGYLHARERLFQMEMIRRVATGTLAEILGPDLLGVDKLFRTLGIARKSEELARTFAGSNSPYKPAAEAYFAGINRFVETGPTPVEFRLIGIPKRPFSITDAFNAVGYMSFGFADGFRVDPYIARVAEELGPQYLEALAVHSVYDSAFLPSYRPADTLTARSPGPDLTPLATLVARIPVPLLHGSNSWLISGSKSASGYPLLENDTHIGFAQPSVWFEAHIEYPGFSLYGHYLAGVPFAILGHNRFAAWGMTMFENDDVDFFREKANPANPAQVWNKDHWENLRIRQEILAIKGQAPDTLTVRESRHGPLIGDLVLSKTLAREPVSVWWGYLHSRFDIFQAIYRLNHCRSMADARQAAAAIQAPGLNIMYADTSGNIAWWAAARLPVRPDHVNSKTLLDGASGRDDYLGYYDFSRNPQAENPPWGFLYTANNQPDTVQGILYPGYYRPADRAGRIQELLRSRNNWRPEDIRQMTADHTNRIAARTGRKMADILAAGRKSDWQEIIDILQAWDGSHSTDAAGPTVYYNLLAWTLYYAMADELGYEDYRHLANTEVMKRSYLKFITHPNNPWWDDTGTPEKETRPDILAKAAAKTMQKLQALSASPAGWQWGQVHTLTHDHPLGKVAALRPFFSVGPFPAPGGNATINNMLFRLDTTGLFPVFAGPAVRTVIDLDDMGGAMSINPTGQSGHFLSPHYDDQARMFMETEFRPQYMDSLDIEANKKGVLHLLPAE